MIIGNFFSNVSVSCPALTFETHYYIDDVCVSVDSLTCYTIVGIIEAKSEDNILIIPNPFSNKISITTTNYEKLEVIL